MSKISIIIPTYNCDQYIADAIESALNQTYKNLEILIIDDGSVDKTAGIVKKYVINYPEKVKYFYQENQGVSVARNYGIKKSNGRFLAFLDSDDLWLPEKIEKQVRFFNQNPSFDMVYTDAYDIGYTKKASRLASVNREEMSGLLLERLLLGNLIINSSVILRKEIIDKLGGFDPYFASGQDWDLWIRIAANNHKIGFIDEVLVGYRIHDKSISRNINLRLKEQLEVINKNFSDLNVTNFLYKKKLAVNKVYSRAAFDYRMTGSYRKAAAAALNCIKLTPLNLMGYKLFLSSLPVLRNLAKKN